MTDRYIVTSESHGTALRFVVWRGEGARFTDRVGEIRFSPRIGNIERYQLAEALAVAIGAVIPDQPLLAVKGFKKKAVA